MQSIPELRLRLHYNPGRLAFEAFVVSQGRDGRRYAAQPVQMTERQPGEFVDSTLELDEAAVQQLADDLWAAGVRPKHAQDTASVTAAMSAHLKSLDEATRAHIHNLQDTDYVRVPRALYEVLVSQSSLQSRLVISPLDPGLKPE